MDKGIYCLVFRNPGTTVRIGALGDIRFEPGWHVYVGSALGPGGLARLERHIRLATLKEGRATWHVDYLSLDPEFRLVYAISAASEEKLECPLACELAGRGGRGIPLFGCSDCRCTSHLFHFISDPDEEIRAAFVSLGLSRTITRLINFKEESTL